MRQMTMTRILLLIPLLLLAACADAFPLSGSNGQTDITIFGTIRNADVCYVDIGAPAGFLGKISLVDEEDKFYALSSGGINGPGRARAYAIFTIPKAANIKRVKFEPLDQLPFSIDWESVPEVSDGRATMKLYNVAGSPYNELMQWTFDIKLTNNDTEPLKIRTDDFTIVDQFGWEYGYAWEYGGSKYIVRGSQIGQLVPGESMRFDLDFRQISKLSRPAVLRYKNLTMDISAWT